MNEWYNICTYVRSNESLNVYGLYKNIAVFDEIYEPFKITENYGKLPNEWLRWWVTCV